MVSIFDRPLVVEQPDGVYEIEADLMLDGRPVFKVTKTETGESRFCKRKRNIALLDEDVSKPSLTQDMKKALKEVPEVSIRENAVN